MHELLLACDEVLEKVDRMAFVRREVRMAVHGQEVEPEQRVSQLKVTYTSRLERYLDAKVYAVSSCLC